MINTLKLSKKLTTKSINVFVNIYDFELYYCKLSLINHPNKKEEEIYIPKNWCYKWIVNYINKNKKELKQLGDKNE